MKISDIQADPQVENHCFSECEVDIRLANTASLVFREVSVKGKTSRSEGQRQGAVGNKLGHEEEDKERMEFQVWVFRT